MADAVRRGVPMTGSIYEPNVRVSVLIATFAFGFGSWFLSTVCYSLIRGAVLPHGEVRDLQQAIADNDFDLFKEIILDGRGRIDSNISLHISPETIKDREAERQLSQALVCLGVKNEGADGWIFDMRYPTSTSGLTLVYNVLQVVHEYSLIIALACDERKEWVNFLAHDGVDLGVALAHCVLRDRYNQAGKFLATLRDREELLNHSALSRPEYAQYKAKVEEFIDSNSCRKDTIPQGSIRESNHADRDPCSANFAPGAAGTTQLVAVMTNTIGLL